MRRELLGLSLFLLPAALAAATAYTLTVNGKPSSVKAIVVNGTTYVPVSALKALGVTATLSGGTLALSAAGAAPATAQQAAGGANQMAALEGCIGETLFNGVWRFKVTSLAPLVQDGDNGWGVTVELRNATQGTLNPFATGMDSGGAAYSLLPPSGNSSVWRAPTVVNDFVETNVPQGGMMAYKFVFVPALNANPDDLKIKPTKFLLRIDTKYVDKKTVPYSVPDPSFRVKLDCQK